MRCQSCKKEEAIPGRDLCYACRGALQGLICDLTPQEEWPKCLLRYIGAINQGE